MESQINKVRYDIKFNIDRVKIKLFALHTQQCTHNCNSDVSCQISFKQHVRDTDRNRTLALNKSVIFVIDFVLKFSYSAKEK